MLPYRSLFEAEAALGRNLTHAETLWLRYSAPMPDYLLYFHSTAFFFLIYALVPLPIAAAELLFPSAMAPFKLQPKVHLPPSSFLKCIKDVTRLYLLVGIPFQIISYPTVKLVGIRAGLPLPSAWETAAQLLVYFLVEDYSNYWIHRALHSEWGYEKIHRVHHEYLAPVGYSGPHVHWAEVLVLGMPTFLGPVLAPGHMITLWLWFALRQAEAIDTHTGFDLPFNPTKLIPFYAGAKHHDYHHFVGRQSKSNFASVFTYCDYIYGTDKGYRFQKAHLERLREQWKADKQNRTQLSNNNGKLE